LWIAKHNIHGAWLAIAHNAQLADTVQLVDHNIILSLCAQPTDCATPSARIYWSIILPLAKAALATVAIFEFIARWRDYLGPLIYLNNQKLYVLSLGLYEYSSQYGREWGLLMAASVLITLPIILLFFFLQKIFVQGIALTGIKG